MSVSNYYWVIDSTFFSGDQFGQSNSFSSGPSFNPRPTYPSGGSNLNWERPSGQESVWNQGGYNWQAPVYPNYQQPFNNNGQSYGSNNNGIVAWNWSCFTLDFEWKQIKEKYIPSKCCLKFY